MPTFEYPVADAGDADFGAVHKDVNKFDAIAGVFGLAGYLVDVGTGKGGLDDEAFIGREFSI